MTLPVFRLVGKRGAQHCPVLHQRQANRRAAALARDTLLVVSLLLAGGMLPAFAATDTVNLGIAQYKDESFEEAAATLQKAYDANDHSFDVIFYLGMSYMQMLEFDKARPYLQQAASMHPDDPVLSTYLGEAFFNLHDYAAAGQVLQEVINRGTESARAYYFLGLARYADGRYRDALPAFGHAAQRDKALQVQALYMQGMAHRQLGDGDVSEAEFRQVVNLAPGSDEAAQARVMLSRPLPRHFSLSLNLSEQYDSNVVLKPASNVAGVNVTRSRDYVSNAAFTASIDKPFNNQVGIVANYGFSQSLHRQLNFFDVMAHHVDSTFYMLLGKDQATLTLNLDGVGVDYRRYLLDFGVMPGFSHDFGDNQRGTFMLGYQRKVFFWPDASGSDNRDANNYQFGYTYTWNAPQPGLFENVLAKDGSSLSVNYTVDIEKAGGNNWSYVGHHVTLSGQYPLNDQLKLILLADQYRQLYRHINTYYGVRRHDNTTVLSPSLEWKLLPWASLKASYAFTRALSNIAIYDYRRSLATLSIEGRY